VNAFASCPTISIKFPIATWSSIKCNPQSRKTWPPTTKSPGISLARGPAGSPWTLTAKYVPLSLETHSAVIKPGKLTKGVSMGLAGVTQAGGHVSAPAKNPPCVPKYACSSPLPPASDAGFVHAAIMFSPGALPKRVLAGGGALARNVT
jgi:hypothetical protein